MIRLKTILNEGQFRKSIDGLKAIIVDLEKTDFPNHSAYLKRANAVGKMIDTLALSADKDPDIKKFITSLYGSHSNLISINTMHKLAKIKNESIKPAEDLQFHKFRTKKGNLCSVWELNASNLIRKPDIIPLFTNRPGILILLLTEKQ